MRNKAAGVSQYEKLKPIMEYCGAKCSSEDFYWAVNDAYHTAESEVYDHMHVEMFLSLGPAWTRLIGALPKGPQRLNSLDVGSGTGLVGEFFNRICPDRIETMTLLDPCAAMLERSKARSTSWGFRANFIHGRIDDVPSGLKFDVITVNSVLHHVVELEDACKRLVNALKPGGVLLTAQDERPGYRLDPVFIGRNAAYRKRRGIKKAANSWLYQKARSIKRIFIPLHIDPLAQRTSEPLIQKGLILRPLDLPSIWAVTDFHVSGQPGQIGEGIHVDNLKSWLQPMELVDYMTYRFHGFNWDSLDTDEQKAEEDWFNANDPHGQIFASAWRNGG